MTSHKGATENQVISRRALPFARSYARAYTAGSPDALPQVNSWLIVHTAARLAEGIDAERQTLVALLEGARRKMSR